MLSKGEPISQQCLVKVSIILECLQVLILERCFLHAPLLGIGAGKWLFVAKLDLFSLLPAAYNSLKSWLAPAVPLLMVRFCGTTPNSTSLGTAVSGRNGGTCCKTNIVL